ncbi:hypothetical protein [Aquabacter spiritensis]|uniref:Uncharacterized protein n=1 Tax=Aquabacter spiritensis TaxID=933073 RepID=A0A4R3M4P0_9HYPH|nr:hypothetical protein [Aquabacter spiritensis]TCT08304.1 hypothetical protein EDC64_101828 [Aquabacter spiritensis]
MQQTQSPPSRPGLTIADVETISKKGFSELLGVSPGRVSQLIASGLPVEPNGRVHIERGKAWVKANIDPTRRRSGGVASLPLFDGCSPRAIRDASEAEIARLKAERLGGHLIDRSATLRAVESRARAERDAWIGWVNRAAPELAAATGTDLAAVVATLDRLVRDHLLMLASLPLGDIEHG